MKQRLFYLMMVCCCASLVSCSSGDDGSIKLPDEVEQPDDNGEGDEEDEWTKIERVTVVSEDLKAAGASTRTSFTLESDRLAFAWAAGDEIGIIPLVVEAESQVKMTLVAGSGEKTATFTGGGWALRSDVTYVAYYPYQLEATTSGITFSYAGQLQTGNASLAHLGTHDFMATMPTSAVEEALNFTFKHLNAVAQFNLTLPVAVTVDKLTLTCNEAELWTSAQLTFTNEGYRYDAITKEYRLSMTIDGITTTEANPKVTLYMNLPPVDLSNKTTYIVLHGTNNRVYQGTLVPKALESGKAYRFDASLIDATMEANIDTPDFSQSEI